MLSEGEEKDTSAQFEENRKTIDFADICIIGGGASGLSAAIAASDVFRREFDNTQSDKEEGTKKGIGESDDSSGGSDGVRTDNRLRRKIVILESNKKQEEDCRPYNRPMMVLFSMKVSQYSSKRTLYPKKSSVTMVVMIIMTTTTCHWN